MQDSGNTRKRSKRGGVRKLAVTSAVILVLSLLLSGAWVWLLWDLRGGEEAGAGAPESSPAVSAVSEPTASFSSSAVASPSASAVEVRRDVVFPNVTQVDRQQVEGVARAAVTSLATWDTRDDLGYGEAVARTVPLFDESLAERVSKQAGEPVHWEERAVEREAFSSPQVMDYDIFSDYTNEVRELSGVSRDGRELRFMQFAVRWNWLGRDGSSWAAERIRVYEMVMVKDEGGNWSVASYAWRDELE